MRTAHAHHNLLTAAANCCCCCCISGMANRAPCNNNKIKSPPLEPAKTVAKIVTFLVCLHWCSCCWLRVFPRLFFQFLYYFSLWRFICICIVFFRASCIHLLYSWSLAMAIELKAVNRKFCLTPESILLHFVLDNTIRYGVRPYNVSAIQHFLKLFFVSYNITLMQRWCNSLVLFLSSASTYGTLDGGETSGGRRLLLAHMLWWSHKMC